MNTREGDKIGLEFVEIDVQATVETKGSSDTGNNLCDDTVKVCESRRRNTEVLLANIIDSLLNPGERKKSMR